MTDTAVADKPNQKPSKWRLTNVVSWYLGFFYGLCWALIFAMVFMTFVVGLNIPDDPADRHTDITYDFIFALYPDQGEEDNIEDNQSPSEIIMGHGNVKLNNTKSHNAWYISQFINLVMLIVALLALGVLRKLFQNLNANEFFHKDNHKFIRQFGYIVISWNIIEPVVVYFGGFLILNDVGQHADNLELDPLITLSPDGIITGFAILILAQIMKEAKEMHQEQELTI